jgi:hypothetical protein
MIQCVSERVVVLSAYMNVHKLAQRENLPSDGQRPQEDQRYGPWKHALPKLMEKSEVIEKNFT